MYHYDTTRRFLYTCKFFKVVRAGEPERGCNCRSM